MQIKNDVLKSCISGAVRFDEADGYLLPRRFTKRQADYVAGNDFLCPMSKMSAGIVTEFFSNTESVSFDAVFMASTRSYYCFDIYVDDILEFHFAKDNTKFGTEKHIEFKLKSGNKKISIYFPCLFETGIKNFCIDDGAQICPTKKNLSFLFFGDSITHGYATRFTSLTYANILSRSFNAQALNQAIAGDVFNVNNLDSDLNYNPDMIFVAYGTNDWWHGIDITDTAKKYFDKLCGIYPKKNIYVILPICRLDFESEQENTVMPFCQFRDLLKRLCEQHKNIKVIDSWDFVPHFPEFFEDGFLHPNDIGSVFYADALKEYIDSTAIIS